MEFILGVIEDLLDKFEKGTPEEQLDAKEALKINITKFKDNLADLVNNGNEKAIDIIEKLNKIDLT